MDYTDPLTVQVLRHEGKSKESVYFYEYLKK